ncbi:MAG: hypothetical protein K2X81_05685 [Candidatus Obscuribacterales bacterium]|nr:hypothetical protein [Candidatus Obscuribacterales bacterium]
MYFSQVGEKPGLLAIMTGLTLGCTAGSGAVIIPDKIGLDGEDSNRTMRTAILTVSLYALGGLAAALAAQLTKRSTK